MKGYLSKQQTESEKGRARLQTGLLTYLVADLSPGLQGLGGAFFILLFDPTPPAGSVLDVERPCAPDVGRGVSAACLPSDEAVVAFGDCTSPSSPSTSMVSTLELVVVVSTDTADLVRFPLLFFTYVIRVAAWEAGIFPAVCRMRHARRPWMAPYTTRKEPRCRSPPTG
jgi:hypothetical protein